MQNHLIYFGTSVLILMGGCDPETRMEGTIRDPAGNPIAGAEVNFAMMRELGSVEHHRLPIQSAIDGSFRIVTVIDGDWHAFLTVEKDGYQLHSEPVIPHEWTSGLEIVLEPIDGER